MKAIFTLLLLAMALFPAVATAQPGLTVRTDNRAGAAHASDIPFLFNTQGIKYGDNTTMRDNAVGDMISNYLVNFVKTGDPNGQGVARWEKYDPKRDVLLDFTASGSAAFIKDPLTATPTPAMP